MGTILETEKDADLRQSIVWALSDSDSDEAVRILARVIRNDSSARVRTSAVQALGEIGTPAAKKVLKEILSEEDE